MKESKISSNSIYIIGSFLLLKPLSRTLVPKVKASISSEAVAKANPSFTRTAHYASASPGASITGHPINLNNFLASLIISQVTLTDLPAILLAPSRSPVSILSFFSSVALSFYSFLVSRTLAFKSGGFPSNTHIGFTPFSKNYIVL